MTPWTSCHRAFTARPATAAAGAVPDGVVPRTRGFGSEGAREAGRAIGTMRTGVSQWYRAGGAYSPQELAERYRAMTCMTVGAPAAPTAPPEPGRRCRCRRATTRCPGPRRGRARGAGGRW
ncbi:hypothetical protein ACIQD1_31665 [Streptomyces sp. NPDC093088]|uniref:hypothetical protein n=1 Tax=unclassified Streptomyces TaxID=2593676 RepID=UPI0036F0EFCA